MKLATLKNDSRDGVLVVVSRNLARCVAVPEIARTLQAAALACELEPFDPMERAIVSAAGERAGGSRAAGTDARFGYEIGGDIG